MKIAKTGRRVAYYSVQQDQRATIGRALNQLGGKNPFTIEELGKLQIHAPSNYNNWNRIVADVRAEHGVNPFSYICIDCPQNIEMDGHTPTTHAEIQKLALAAKDLAKEIGGIVCLPSHQYHDPEMPGANAIESIADAVLIITETISGEIHSFERLSLSKSRDSATSVTIPVTFNPAMTRFEDIK